MMKREFYNVVCKKALQQKHGIKYLSINSDNKAAADKRFNRIFKTATWKCFYSKGIYGFMCLMN